MKYNRNQDKFDSTSQLLQPCATISVRRPEELSLNRNGKPRQRSPRRVTKTEPGRCSKCKITHIPENHQFCFECAALIAGHYYARNRKIVAMGKCPVKGCKGTFRPGKVATQYVCFHCGYDLFTEGT